MSASQTFEAVLTTIKSSNLNFHLQQSPFSAVICIKKSLIKDKSGNLLVPPPSEAEMIVSLKSENQKLSSKLVQLENVVSKLQGNLEDAVLDSENIYKSKQILENELCSVRKNLKIKHEVLKDDLTKKDQEIDKLNILNRKLEEKEIEAKVIYQKQLKLELSKKENTIKNMIDKNERLENKVEHKEFENKELTIALKQHEFKISELNIKLRPSSTTTTSSNTTQLIFCSTASQSEPIHPAPKIEIPACSHFGCYTRQPHNPPSSSNTYQRPPSNIRLLPKSVSSYEVYSSLQVNHECEECEEGALFCNYYEMVEYPATGPSGGTYGSPVTVCPNHPHASINLLDNSTEERKKILRKNVSCKLCDKKFVQKTHLLFHMKRIH